jgi:sulfite dehydrogenase (cytochrome) subunit A
MAKPGHSDRVSPALFSRRQLLRWGSAAGFAGLFSAGCSRRLEEAPAEAEPYLRFPGKVAMRVVNDRAPCLETPWRYFRADLTPNEAFYVRWHLEAIPTAVDLRTWRLRIGGHVNKPLELSLDDLRRMKATSLVAVNQCSGNSRSYFQPRVPGGQWGHGAMGNARWTGVPLRDLLNRAGLKAKSEEVTFNGLDDGPLPSVPDFVKALKVPHALEPELLVAYEMNGWPLPMLNGFPVRLVVPGWFATYWVKALTEITVLPHRFDGYWMQKAYLLPDNPNANETPQALATKTVPISRLVVRSFFVRPEAEERLPAGQSIPLEGIAVDGGHGIKQVQFSTDGGASWSDARLGDDLGKFSFRRWRAEWTPPGRGTYRLQVRAVNGADQNQPAKPIWNHGGYAQNVIDEIRVDVL